MGSAPGGNGSGLIEGGLGPMPRSLSPQDTLKKLKNGPKTKRNPAPPETPEKKVDEAQVAARRRTRERAANYAGYQGTIATGPSGLTTAATTAPKTLLGS